MNILNKFSKIQVDPSKTLLKGEDLEFCTNLEKEYETAYHFFELEKEFISINNEANTFLDFNDFLETVDEKIRTLNQKFIQKVVWHFTEKYKISLDIKTIEDKIFPTNNEYRSYDRWRYKNEGLEIKLSLAQILNPFSEFLNGMTLDEKAESEIKNKFYEYFAKLYHQDKPRVELIKNRLEFSMGRFCFDSSWKGEGYKFTYNSEGIARTLFLALSFFEDQSTEVNSKFHIFLDNSYKDMFSEYEIDLEKVKSIRFYKNGKVVPSPVWNWNSQPYNFCLNLDLKIPKVKFKKE